MDGLAKILAKQRKQADDFHTDWVDSLWWLKKTQIVVAIGVTALLIDKFVFNHHWLAGMGMLALSFGSIFLYLSWRSATTNKQLYVQAYALQLHFAEELAERQPAAPDIAAPLEKVKTTKLEKLKQESDGKHKDWLDSLEWLSRMRTVFFAGVVVLVINYLLGGNVFLLEPVGSIYAFVGGAGTFMMWRDSKAIQEHSVYAQMSVLMHEKDVAEKELAKVKLNTENAAN